MPTPPWRERLADALGLIALLLALLDYLRPSLLFLPTITAGGDTPCHYPTAVWFYEQLLPRGRLHGWYPGAYLGQPLLLYYFPLPFLLMSAFAPLTGMPVAFKLGTALGIFLLPLAAYVSFRLLGFRFPAPLLGAAAAVVFLFVEENPIWGGTIASALTGEFSYSYGIALAVLFLGVAYRTYARGSRPFVPALLLGLTAFAHGYAVLWAGLSAAFFLYYSRRPRWTLTWLMAVGGLAFAFAGLALLPLLADWGWTTPYDDPWITVTTTGLFPPLLWPLFALAALGLLGTFLLVRRNGGPDHRLLFLLHAALVGAALAAAGPALGVIDIRFVPFAQLAAALAGAAALGLLLRGLAAPDLAALGLVVFAIFGVDTQSRVLRPWIDWNYSGLEAKELWPAFQKVTDLLRGSAADPRVAVEYSAVHERAGSIRMYETIPHFSGRSTLEGVYNQASLSTHFVYYLASELGATSPNPFRSREYSRFDTDGALAHLRLFNTRDVVALSTQLVSALQAREDVSPVAEIPPYAVFRLRDSGPGYVEPLAYAPVRSSPKGWRDKSYRWFMRKPFSPAFLVFSDDPRFDVVEKDEWLAPTLVPLEAGAEATAELQAESITIQTNRPGHPVLVKVSYHPRWKAEGAEGPFLVSPSLMMVIPRGKTARLVYARTAADHIGLVLTLGAFALWAGWARHARRRVPAASAVAGAAAAPILDGCAAPPPPRRWGGLIPASLVLLLVGARFVAGTRAPAVDRNGLYEKASRAYAEERFDDAAEYARHALSGDNASPLRAELWCLQGESLLRLGRPREAIEAFEAVVAKLPESPYMPQALFGRALAREAAGEVSGASADRRRLAEEFADTPWARRAEAGHTPPVPARSR
jgi:6-pyruvoyl-tetrahydropterin synthase related domain